MKTNHCIAIISILLLILPACRQPFQLYYLNSFAFLEQTKNLPHNALFVFDVDETLFAMHPSRNGEESPLNHIFQKTFRGPELEKNDQMLHKLIPLVIEPCIVNFIQRLQDQGIPVIALTACYHDHTGLVKDAKEYRIHLLKSVGIHFENSFPKVHKLEFYNLTHKNHTPLFYEGVLFSQPCKKGAVLATFLKAMNLNPTLYYFDNSQQDVEDVKEMADLMDIPGMGFIYRGLDLVPDLTIQLYNHKLRHLVTHNEWIGKEATQ